MDTENLYYVIIPATVWQDDRLTPQSKILYGQISALCNTRGYCWATNSYLGKINNVDKTTVSKWISKLEECCHIKSELEKDENGEIKARFIKISIPLGFSTNTPIGEIAKYNSKSLNTKEDTTSVQAKPSQPAPVNWDACKSDLQRFMGYYIKLEMPDIYKGTREQVNGFFKQYGRMFSTMLATAGTLDTAQMAVDEAKSYYRKLGYPWGLKALNGNWAMFVNQVLERKRRTNGY